MSELRRISRQPQENCPVVSECAPSAIAEEEKRTIVCGFETWDEKPLTVHPIAVREKS
jgi:hypothetical protein